MSQAMEDGQKRIDKVLVIKQDNMQVIGKRLHEIVDNCIEIDTKAGSDLQKRQRINEEEQRQRDINAQR